MSRSTPLALLLLIAAACGSEEGGLDASTPDAGATPVDSGVVTVRPDSGTTTTLPMPTVTNVSPRTGPETGGTRVTLRGTNLTEPAEVFFGDAPATSVVVLDAVSIAATAPAGAIGPVTVRVVTDGGEAELPEGFTYHRELRLDAVAPARIPDEGGVQVTLTGRGFDDETLVYFDRVPLRGVVVQDAQTLVGWAPALAPGRPEIRVITAEADVRKSDLVTVFATPEVQALAPGYGPIDGGAVQEAVGEGLLGATEARIGGALGTDLTLGSDTRLTFGAPALAVGAHDVQVANADARSTLVGGYVAYDPADTALQILGVTPQVASTSGGAQVTVVGSGFSGVAQVEVGATVATVASAGPNAIVFTVPAGLVAGAQDVLVRTSSTTSVVAAGALTLYDPVEVTAISPSSGPASGGTAVTITGVGFSQGVQDVRIADVPLADVVVVSDTEITATTVAGSHGLYDVVVRTALTSGVLEKGFAFEEPFQILRIEPTEGSIAGNTYVSVFGRGFTEPASVRFGALEGVAPRIENGGLIGVRTQPSGSGRVDVDVDAGAQGRLPLAFTYYDPRLITGGAWGGPIEGSVNVAVMASGGAPVAGAVVQLGYDADPRYRQVTDENGLATISGPEIRGAQTITAGRDETEFVTFMELDAKNLTMIASPYPQSMPDDAPRSPCPVPQTAPSITGRVFKIKSSLDPVTMPGWQPLVRITYTQANVFSANPPDPPEQVTFVFQEGQSYEITVMRVGTVAVYGTLGDYNPETNAFIPRRMGIATSVPVAPGSQTANIDLEMDIPLTQSTLVRLDDPPLQPGDSINAVFPYLNLGSDGVIPFPAVALQGTGDIFVDELPAVSESEFIYMAGSFSWDLTTGQLRNPYSLNIVETAAPFEEGVDLGPYLDMPQNLSPKAGEVLEDGRFSWDLGGVVPDITTITVYDSKGVSGCCCIDANQNGQCDALEDEQCGAVPQAFNRWSVFAQGGLQSYAMPRMPAPLEAFDAPALRFYRIQQAVAPRFDYREFIYNQFSPFFWRSWTVFDSSFVAKEATD